MSGTNIDLPESMHIEGQPSEEHAEHRPSPRDEMMARIAERAEERRQQEMADAAAAYDEPPEAEPAPEPAPEPTPAAVAPPAPPPPAAPEAPAMRAVVLDGQQFAVTEAQYAQLAQLGMVANLALHQPTPIPSPEPPPEPPKSLVDHEAARRVIKEIQYGGEDAAVPALVGFVEDVLKRVPTPQVDPNAIVAQAVRAAEARAQLAADTQVIRQEYPDVFADPQRTLLANLNVNAIRARNAREGRYQSDLDVYREAGNAVYDACRLPRPGSQIEASPAPQAAPVIREDVIERKRAAPRTTQVIDRRAAPPETPRPPTGSEIVDQIKRSRGQIPLR